ncbi:MULTISPECIES: hypothetical protein [unclassified Nonomuraea]
MSSFGRHRTPRSAMAHASLAGTTGFAVVALMNAASFALAAA